MDEPGGSDGSAEKVVRGDFISTPHSQPIDLFHEQSIARASLEGRQCISTGSGTYISKCEYAA